MASVKLNCSVFTCALFLLSQLNVLFSRLLAAEKRCEELTADVDELQQENARSLANALLFKTC